MARRPLFIECSVDGCENNAHRSGGGSRGCCNTHYYRLWKHGDPLAGATFRNYPKQWVEDHKSYGLDDCLKWPFGKASKGYGLICIDGRNTQASRYMCIVAHGDPSEPSLHAAHTCHNGHLGCVNPNHLEWQTRAENNKIKPRARIGSASPKAKLTEANIVEMRNLYEAKITSQKFLAERFGISAPTVCNILKRKTWRHV